MKRVHLSKTMGGKMNKYMLYEMVKELAIYFQRGYRLVIGIYVVLYDGLNMVGP